VRPLTLSDLVTGFLKSMRHPHYVFDPVNLKNHIGSYLSSYAVTPLPEMDRAEVINLIDAQIRIRMGKKSADTRAAKKKQKVLTEEKERQFALPLTNSRRP
jgi:hypothetical protein